MSDANEPLVPRETDLRDFPYTPILRTRLFGSAFHAESNDSEWRAGVTLWLKAWDQVPAGSLPNDDVSLCRLAELGRDLKSWRKVKAGALRGWKLADDGLLYHEVVAEVVLEGWLEKLGQQLSGGAGNAKRWGFEWDPSALEVQIALARKMLFAIAPNSRVFRKAKRPTSPRPPPGNGVGTPDRIPDGSPDGNPDGIAERSQEKLREVNELQNRDSVVTPDIPGHVDNLKGAVSNIEDRRAEQGPWRTRGQQWRDRQWVEATAKTVEVVQRTGEVYAEYRDRVYAALDRRMKIAGVAI